MKKKKQKPRLPKTQIAANREAVRVARKFKLEKNRLKGSEE